jgi:hypothetical protein
MHNRVVCCIVLVLVVVPRPGIMAQGGSLDRATIEEVLELGFRGNLEALQSCTRVLGSEFAPAPSWNLLGLPVLSTPRLFVSPCFRELLVSRP